VTNNLATRVAGSPGSAENTPAALASGVFLCLAGRRFYFVGRSDCLMTVGWTQTGQYQRTPVRGNLATTGAAAAVRGSSSLS